MKNYFDKLGRKVGIAMLIFTALIGLAAVTPLTWKQISDITTTKIEVNLLHGFLGTTTELNRATVGIKSSIQAQADSIKTAINAKPDTSQVLLVRDTINPITSGEIYSAAAVNGLFAEANATMNQMKLLDSSIKTVPFGFNLMQSTSGQNLADGNQYFIAQAPVSGGTVLTGITLRISTTGTYVADNFNGIGLYKLVGTNLIQVAISANSATPFTTGGIQNIPFTTPFTTIAGELYFASVLNNNSTPNVLCAMFFNTTFHPNVTAWLFVNKRFTGELSSQTTMQETIPIANINSAGFTAAILCGY